MNELNKLRKILNLPLTSFSKEEEVRINAFLTEYSVLKQISGASHHHLYKHLIGVAKEAFKLSVKYCDEIGLNNKEYISDTAAIGGFLHDSGKVLKDLNIKTEYDSIKIELLLRKYKLTSIALSVRHNPYLFLFDWHNGNLTIPQLIVTYADTCIDKSGRKTTRERRLKEILKSKNINKIFQNEFWDILNNIFISMSIRVPINMVRISFFERCDGKYRVENNKKYLDTLSSYHIAKVIYSMGYEVSIMSDSPDNFNFDGIKFQSVGRDPLTAYNTAKHSDIVFVTGWTTLFRLLIQNNNVLPLLVMRSLKYNSLTDSRLEIMRNNAERIILVSESSKYLLKKHLRNEVLQMNIIPNGLNKKQFHYKKKKIKKQFVYVGSLVEEKGFNEVLELAKKLPDYKCILIGSSEMYGKKTQEFKNLPPNVMIIGQQSQDLITKYYSESLFAVAFTKKDKIFETFGKSIIEAQSCGCPVIALKNGGLFENLIDKSVNKIYFSFNSEIIAKYIVCNYSKLSNHKLRKDLSQAAKIKFLNWELVAQRYLLLSQERLLLTLADKLKNKNNIREYLYS